MFMQEMEVGGAKVFKDEPDRVSCHPNVAFCATVRWLFAAWMRLLAASMRFFYNNEDICLIPSGSSRHFHLQ